MSLQFNDTTNRKGIIQLIEKECGFNSGDISGNTSLLADFTADVNVTYDDFMALAIASSGTWEFDDSNQTDYPFIQTNLVSGQRDYSFLTDGSGNLILDIYRVMIANSSGLFSEISPINQQALNNNDPITGNTDSFINGQNLTGIPVRYDKTANAIFLDPIPNYNYTNGLKVYVNREAAYFNSSDTTKKPGVPGILHEYFALKPSMKYAARKTLSNYKDLAARVEQFEDKIQEYFTNRPRDTKKRLRGNVESNK